MPEVLLVVLGHPEVERAGIQVGAQAAGGRARRAPADPVGVEAVSVGIEPAVTVGLRGPLPIEERLHLRHPRMLAGLHLGARPVDRVDLRLRRRRVQGAEEVVGRAGVVLEEVVRLDVVDDVAVPLLSRASSSEWAVRPRTRGASAARRVSALTVPASMSA